MFLQNFASWWTWGNNQACQRKQRAARKVRRLEAALSLQTCQSHPPAPSAAPPCSYFGPDTETMIQVAPTPPTRTVCARTTQTTPSDHHLHNSLSDTLTLPKNIYPSKFSRWRINFENKNISNIWGCFEKAVMRCICKMVMGILLYSNRYKWWWVNLRSSSWTRLWGGYTWCFALVHLCEVGDTWCCAMVHMKTGWG